MVWSGTLQHDLYHDGVVHLFVDKLMRTVYAFSRVSSDAIRLPGADAQENAPGLVPDAI